MAIISSREDSQIVTVLPFSGSLNISSQSILISPDEPTMTREEIELMQYYATYNVWTGIRTALVLTLFFLFTVTIILYKSKCKRHRRYELHPSLEDIPQRPLDYYEYWCPTPVGGGDNFSNASKDMYCRIFDGGVVDSLGSAPLPTKMRGNGSFSSIYSSFRIKSLPGSVMRMNFSRMNSLEGDEVSRYTVPSLRHEYLRVPGVRLQSTGSSSDGYSVGSSSCDYPSNATPMTHLGVPGMSGKSKPMMPTGGIDWEHEQATAEWLQTIDINVILPTPSVSPSASIRSISDNMPECAVKLGVPRRGRLSSYSSIESQDFDTTSMASDSVFLDDSFCEEEINYPRKFTRSPAKCLTSVQSLDETSRRSSLLRALSPDSRPKHSSLKEKKRTVHSFRIPLNPYAACSPMPAMLEGHPLQAPKVSSRDRRNQGISNLGLPIGVSISGSCERLAAHEGLMEQIESLSQNTSTASLQLGSKGSSFEDDPVITSYIVPGLRRVNSAMQKRNESTIPKFRRAESDVASTHRQILFHQDSTSSSSSTEASDSVSFHLMVPHLSFDCPSADTSRASSPTMTPTPPGSPLGISLSVPSSFHSSLSPTRGRLRSQVADMRGVLKRQYSQFTPASPREKSPSPFGLPTSFEEEELEEQSHKENVNANFETALDDTSVSKKNECFKDAKTDSKVGTFSSSASSVIRKIQCCEDFQSINMKETKF